MHIIRTKESNAMHIFRTKFFPMHRKWCQREPVKSHRRRHKFRSADGNLAKIPARRPVRALSAGTALMAREYTAASEESDISIINRNVAVENLIQADILTQRRRVAENVVSADVRFGKWRRI